MIRMAGVLADEITLRAMPLRRAFLDYPRTEPRDIAEKMARMLVSDLRYAARALPQTEEPAA